MKYNYNKLIVSVLACFLICCIICSCISIQSPVAPDTQPQYGAMTEQVSVQDSDTEQQTVTSVQTEAATSAETDALTSSDTSITTPSDAPSNTLRLVMVGDVLMHDPVIASGVTDSGYSYGHLFENITDEIADADIAMLNQEVIIAGEKYGIGGYPCFNAPMELADAIAEAGFNVAVHATNHTLDVGKAAMLSCLENWQTKYPHIEVVGMHDSERDAEHISIIEQNGIKVAILNYTYTINRAGTAALAKDPYLVDLLDEDRIRNDTKTASEAADFVIVAAHWGTEYSHVPSSSQKRWAKLMLECGVDLVLGTHPHVIQPVEWLEDGEGNKMLVYWSLGNFVNCTSEKGPGKGARMLGAMADVEIRKDTKGTVYIGSASAIPLVTFINYGERGITTYKLSEYTESMHEDNRAVDIDPTFTYGYCTETFDDILGDFIKESSPNS